MRLMTQAIILFNPKIMILMKGGTEQTKIPA
jgi:hypothetical protein